MTAKDEALRLAREGLSVRDISRTLGVPRATVGDWVQVSPGRTRGEIMDVSREREEKAVALFKDGQSARQIGTELSISHMQVTRLLRRAGVMLCLLVVASFGAPPAQAHLSVENLVSIARGSAWGCDFDHDGAYGPKQNRCVVRVVFKREPWVGAQAERIISCESGWDEQQVTPPYSASGLAQFLPSTWWNTPFRRHSVFHPVYNVRAMQWLFHHDGGSWREWVCRP